ncbi:hypothetical protein ACNE9Y_24885 [Pseudomonas sp. NY11226]|uniref:hypothetical protein n=1 Tax=Pseudomonas sp. NY11226 TaxID=3400362 RepID=UPI003A8A49D0
MIEHDQDVDPFAVDPFTEEGPAPVATGGYIRERSDLDDYLCSPRETQLAHWLHSLGLTWSKAFYHELLLTRGVEIPWLQPVIDAGRDWSPIYLLPRADSLGMLEYMVHSKRTPGLIWRCRYKQGGWQDFHTDQPIYGVTHWRIAKPGEGATEIDPSELPGHFMDQLRGGL